MSNRVGQQIGRYRLTKLLGRGGSAEVYRAEHVLINTQIVAIKLLLTQLVPKVMESFLEEARTIAQLRHPNIVRLLHFDIDANTGLLYLVMDYAPHGSLRQRHPEGTQLPLPTVIDYVNQAALALHYAHERKIIHRDVKPENMLLDEDNKLLLSDFGLATIAHTPKSMKTQGDAGTIYYMAPEQIKGKPQYASDQYALAITVYEWLCGIHPFTGTMSIEVAMKHVNDTPLPLHKYIPTLPRAIEHIILKALAKNPQQRFENILTFAHALEQASHVELPKPRSAATPAKSQAAVPRLQRQTPVTAKHAIVLQEEVIVRPYSAILNPRLIITRRATIITGATVSVILLGGGLILYATSQLTAKLPPISMGTRLYTYKGHTDTVHAVVWSPDGKRIASGSQDITVQVWNADSSGHPFIYKGHTSYVWAVAWSPNDNHIASGSFDGTIQIWNADGSGHPFTYTNHTAAVIAIAWSPDSKHIASGLDDNTVQIWNVNGGGHPFIYKGHSDIVRTVAWSSDSKHIASGSFDKTVQIWNIDGSGQPFIYKGHTAAVIAVAWSPDGKRIASGSGDNTVQVWNVDGSGQPFVYKGHTDSVYAVAWSPDGKYIASGSWDKTVQVWDANSREQPFIYKGHTDRVSAVAWSPNGKRIASGSYDKTVQVWTAE